MPLQAVHIPAQSGHAQASGAPPCGAFADSRNEVEILTADRLYPGTSRQQFLK